MFLDYRPDGGEVQRFEWLPGRVRSTEAAQLERSYSKLAGERRTYDQLKSDVIQGSIVARRVVLHYLLRKQHPVLRIEDVDPFEDEIDMQFSKDELEDILERTEKSDAVSDSEKEMLVAGLRQEIAEAPESERSGKAPSPTSETATG
jgi:hypothetical protein